MTTTAPGSTGTPKRSFAVIGATGQQGGATARSLLAAGVGVRALTRSPDSAAARALAAQGGELVRADVEDSGSLRSAFGGVDGLFAMTTFAGPKGTEGETEDGIRIAEAASSSGVPHVVYSSVGGAERATGIPHFESKRRVEEHMSALGLSTTFVRPTFFMENFSRFMAPQEEDGVLVLRAPLAAGVPLQMIAVDDIGAVTAAALLDPDRVPGGAVEIAGDELTPEQIAETYGGRAGMPARFDPLPLAMLAADPDQLAMFTWFSRLPAYQADLGLTRSLAPGTKDFAAWLAAGN